MYLVCQHNPDGTMTDGTLAKTYALYADAKAAAERAAALDQIAVFEFVVYKSFSVSRRLVAPVKTTLIEHSS